jgi:hypothetical protein
MGSVMSFGFLIGSGSTTGSGCTGSGSITGAGGAGCMISMVSGSGVSLLVSNLKLGTTTTKSTCSNIEQTTAQMSVLSLKLEWPLGVLIVISKRMFLYSGGKNI